MCPCGQLPAGSVTQIGIPELTPVDCALCVTLVSTVVCLSTTKYQSSIRLCGASTVQLNIANLGSSGICRINVNTIFALGMAQNDHITRTKMCAGCGFSAPCNLRAIVDPKAETIHAVGLEALSNHRVCGRIFIDSIVQCHNPATILKQQRYAGIDIILASKDLRLVEQDLLFHVAKGEVVAHLNGDRVLVRNHTLLQIHLGHGIDLNRAQVTQLLVSEIAADVFAYVVNSIDILIAIDIAALVPATEQIILISSLFTGIGRSVAIVQNHRAIRSSCLLKHSAAIHIAHPILAH